MIRVLVPRDEAHAVAYTKIILDATKSQNKLSALVLNDFKPENGKTNVAVLALANYLSRDLQMIVCDLQQLIVTYRNEKEVVALLSPPTKQLNNTIEELSKISIEDIPGNKSYVLKSLDTIESQSNELSKINFSNLKFQHKHQVVFILADLFLVLWRIFTRVTVQNSTVEEIKDYVGELRNSNIDAVNSLSSEDPPFIAEVVRQARRSVQRLLEITEELDVEADNYDGQVREIILLTAANLADLANKAMEALNNDTDMETLKAALSIYFRSMSVPMGKILSGIENKIDDERTSNNINNLTLTVIVYVLSVGFQFSEALKQLVQVAQNKNK